ncbi:MAG: nicotinate-nucleotide adenylyltransferase [Candidatus Gorgyraea atricola]|nr:nicotinate-nucleotide adenylyltransferase [Candidatus Gorgyraea atricola]
MRIGILGGTFDPIHNGHIHLARELCKRLALKKIIFIPTYIPPHKPDIRISSGTHRHNMVKLAIARSKKLELSGIELKRKGKSYSVDTLRQLKRRYGKKAQFFFITGSDSLKDIDKWRDIEEILRLCTFVVVKRPGFSMRNIDPRFLTLHINAKNVSSSDIRRKVKDRQSITRLVPASARNYIEKRGLYQHNLINYT